MPKNQKKTGRQNYDWAKIQHEYVTDPSMTLRKIAAKHGINYKTVALRSKAEGWFATRKKCQSEVISKGISKTTDKLAAELSQTSDFLALMQGHMSRMLSDSEQFQRQIYVDPINGELKEKVCDKSDTRAMKDAMQTLKLIEEMTRSLYNLQKAETIQKHQIEAERLALDREKFEWEKQKSEYSRPDTTNAIRIDGFEEGWSE